jgi:NTF2 fold immunity protein
MRDARSLERLMGAMVVFALAAPVHMSAQTVQAEAKHSYTPANGLVPDSATAVRIAEAVLVPIYSESVVAKERPFRATLVGEVWIVEGTLPCDGTGDCVGGVAVVEISKKDGRVLRVSHGK